MSLKEWVCYWLVTYKRITVKKSTFDSYIQYARNVTCETEIEELTTADLQNMVNEMSLEGRKLSTIEHMLTVVRQSLKKARSLGKSVNLSIFENLEIPRGNKKIILPLRREQLERIRNNASRSFYGDFFLALTYSGLRAGELIALRWCDVDMAGRVANIRFTDYRGELQPVKTAHGVRALPLCGDLWRVIRRQRRGRDSDRVFTNTRGERINYRSCLDAWHNYLDKLGFERCGFHVLRHTFAHVALRAGVPLKVVSCWLGHADVAITLNVYDAVDEYDMFNAAQLIGAAFGGGGAKPEKDDTGKARIFVL